MLLSKRKGDQNIPLGACGCATVALPLLFGLACANPTPAHSQVQQTTPSRDVLADTRALKFKVVSIHQDKDTNPRRCHQHIGAATPNGYHMTCMFMAMPILQAYSTLESGGKTIDTSELNFIGFPAWVASERYDINARVAPEDLAAWKNPASQPSMMRAMLRSMLADRLKLVVHHGTKIVPVYLLQVAKDGPRFNPAKPGEHPQGRYRLKLPGGGEMAIRIHNGERVIHYAGISIPQLARFWSGTDGRMVVDDTGLKGAYDITLRESAPQFPHQSPGPQPPSPAAGPSVFSKAHTLGLKLVPANRPVETLVLDHIERPSPN